MARVSVRSSASRGEASSPPKQRKSPSPTGPRTRSGRSRSHSVEPEAAVSRKKPGKKIARQASVESDGGVTSAASSVRATPSRKTIRAPPLNPDLSVVEEIDSSGSEHSEDEGIGLEGPSPHSSAVLSPLSGTTTRTTYSEGEMGEMDRSDQIANSLPTLFVNSSELLDLLAPDNATAGDVKDITKLSRLPGQPFASQLKEYEDRFKSVKQTYGSDIIYIRASVVLKKVNGTENADDGNWRPDPVIYAANLATLVLELVPCIEGSEATRLALLSICQVFPKAFVGNFDGYSEVFSTQLMDQTFDLALNLLVQKAIACLRHDSTKPHLLLASCFFESLPDLDDLDPRASFKEVAKDATLKNILHTGNTQNQVDIIYDTMASISEAFHTGKDEKEVNGVVDFTVLETQFPWLDFITAVVQWSRLRFTELSTSIKHRGGIENIKQSLIELLENVNSQSPTPSSPARSVNQQRRPAPSIAPGHQSNTPGLTKAKLMKRKRSEADNYPAPKLGATAASSSSHTLTRSTQGVPVPIPTELPATKRQKRIQPILDNENDDHVDEDLDSTAEYTTAWNEHSREKNKENQTPAVEPNAQRISNDRDLSQKDVAGPSAPKHSRARREESEQSEDQGFQEDQRRTDDRRRRATALTARRNSPEHEDQPQPRARAQVNGREPSSRVESNGAAAPRQEDVRAALSIIQVQDEEDGEDYPAPSSTQAALSARLETARARGPQPPRGRTPWSDEDSDRLLAGIAEWGCSWTMIEQTQAFDIPRGQVALKDRARNMKVQYLKNRWPLPVGFENVALGRKEKDAVKAVVPEFDE
ncbi:uncharacterized protein L3040_006131 [Drepanopeziza brunnea f. sp. 'multigermtubi']|uniref:uncharacterized protein n=1 Tax=Drepanopeziza brunnea f. sp. 'multigermtubi' TaxID=698441 RepID=UPI00238E22D7|nr:hypothetical protein L3040_006131 [Drepanopeziza brunnea f. sp. 'multigermtubi']